MMCVYYKRVQDFFFSAPVSEEVVSVVVGWDGSVFLGVFSETLVLPSAVGIAVFSSVWTGFSVVLSNDLTSALVSFFSSSITKIKNTIKTRVRIYTNDPTNLYFWEHCCVF